MSPHDAVTSLPVPLARLAKVVRSKNAGPTQLTVDIFFHDADGYARAVAYYRRCYMTWKKYEAWAAKSYFAEAKILATKLDQKDGAKRLIQEMLQKDRIKDTREATEAKAFLLGL